MIQGVYRRRANVEQGEGPGFIRVSALEWAGALAFFVGLPVGYSYLIVWVLR